MQIQKLYNPIVIHLLRSPLHGLMSKSTMLITYTGRRSGRTYTTPVNYVRDGDTLLTVASHEHNWWKNLRGVAPVTVRVRGRDLQGVGEAFEGEDAVAEGGLLTVMQSVPAYRWYFGIELDEEGSPKDQATLEWIARTQAVVRIKGLTPV